jgi:phosphomannomutase
MNLTAFKAYDVRGRLGVDLDAGIVRRIARAFVIETGAVSVVLARDCRLSSPELAQAVVEGVAAAGAQVLDLGMAGTEEMYFAVAHLGAGGGIMVTASHNPMDYNGLKMVGPGSVPLSDEVFRKLCARAEAEKVAAGAAGARRNVSDLRGEYVARVLGFVDPAQFRPLHVLVNAGNGAAGPTFDRLAEGMAARDIPLRFTRMFHDPDGTFPNGIPNPLLAENQPVTAAAVRVAGADLGVAFDGDFDRCFLFDAEGGFVAGEYVVALLAAAFLAKEPGATIVQDPRVIWATADVVARGAGRAVLARTGHVYLKAAMRREGAVYGGEMSAHHYFRDFMCCDSGMIPWLLVAEVMGRTGRSLADLVAALRADFPSSGEINFTVTDAAASVARVEAALAPEALARDDTDGMSLDFGQWRLNLRRSNTEPLLRLNVEARGDAALVAAAVARVTTLIKG